MQNNHAWTSYLQLLNWFYVFGKYTIYNILIYNMKWIVWNADDDDVAYFYSQK